VEPKIKAIIEQHILEGNIPAALDHLFSVELGPLIRKEALSIAARYRSLQHKKRVRLLSFETETITLNQITTSLLELIQHSASHPFPQEQRIDVRFPKKKLWWKYLLVCFLVLTFITSGYVFRSLLFPSPTPLTVTILAHTQEGIDHPALPSRGVVTLAYGDALITQQVNEKGEVTFKQIPEAFFSEQARVNIWFSDPLGEPYRAVYSDSLYRLEIATHIRLLVNIEDIDRLRGTVKEFSTGNPVDSAEVRVQGISTYTNRYGEFDLRIPPDKQRQHQTIRVFHPSYEDYERMNVPVITDLDNQIMIRRKIP